MYFNVCTNADFSCWLQLFTQYQTTIEMCFLLNCTSARVSNLSEIDFKPLCDNNSTETDTNDFVGWIGSSLMHGKAGSLTVSKTAVHQGVVLALRCVNLSWKQNFLSQRFVYIPILTSLDGSSLCTDKTADLEQRATWFSKSPTLQQGDSIYPSANGPEVRGDTLSRLHRALSLRPHLMVVRIMLDDPTGIKYTHKYACLFLHTHTHTNICRQTHTDAELYACRQPRTEPQMADTYSVVRLPTSRHMKHSYTHLHIHPHTQWTRPLHICMIGR